MRLSIISRPHAERDFEISMDSGGDFSRISVRFQDFSGILVRFVGFREFTEISESSVRDFCVVADLSPLALPSM